MEVMGVLIEAGADPNSRNQGGATPLFGAAFNGQVDVVKLLLRAKADPLLTCLGPLGVSHAPLDVAAQSGHWEVVHELIQGHGIEGCGGETGGLLALGLAAQDQHVRVTEELTRGGVFDTRGSALQAAARHGRESSVKFLLRQRNSSSGEGGVYMDIHTSPGGATALVWGIMACSPRITRMLVDAGADTTIPHRLTNKRRVVVFDDTPLAYTKSTIRAKKIQGKEATESDLHGLEAIRRLLMRVEAVHAVSWLWATDVTHSAVTKASSRSEMPPTPLTSMLPILRRRAGRPRVLLAALFRNSVKP